MISQPARVVSLETTGYWLETLPKSACPRCAEGKGCGGGILAQAFANKTYRLFVPFDVPAEESPRYGVDAQVQVAIDSRGLLWASLIMYLLPLMSILCGAFLIGKIGDFADVYTVTGAAVGLIVGAGIARYLSRTLVQSSLTRPQILREPATSCWYPAD